MDAPIGRRTRSQLKKRKNEEEVVISGSLFTHDDLATHRGTIRNLKKLRLRIEKISPIAPRELWKVKNKYSAGYNVGTLKLEELPDSLIAHCLFSGYLNTNDIIKTLTKVNKHLRDIARTSVTLLDLRRYTNITPMHMERIVSRFKNLSTIDLTYCPQIGNSHVAKLLPLAPTLRVLKLRGTAVSDRGVVKYISKLENLEALDLSKTNAKQSRLLGNSAVSALSESCQKLRILQMGWCSKVDDTVISSLTNLKKLEELDLSLTNVTSKACSSLSILNLKRVDLSATNITTVGIKELVTPTITFAGITKGVTCKLEELKLRHVSSLDRKALRQLALHTKDLQLLDISYCDGINMTNSDVRASLGYLAEKGATILPE